MIRYPLPRREALVGASATNDIVVPFPGVSRVHARAIPTPNGVTISDCGSKNGIRHAGQRIDEFELVEGEVLQIGRAELRIEEHSTSDVMVLPLAARDSTPPSAETQSDEEDLGSGAVAALACARALAATSEAALARPSNPLLTRCRRALGASAIVLFAAREGEPTIFLSDGEVPNAEVLQFLHRRAAGREPFVTSIGDISAIVCRVDRRCLAVIGSTETWEHWQREFAGVLAVRIGRHSQRRPTEASAGVPGSLVIPEGMIVGESPAIHRLLEQMRMTLRSQLDVLLLGETGTGKELFARLIHASSENASGPFVAINCAAIPGELLESQLFGVQGRVATGVDPYPGLFILANGGTILLDEIGELAEPLQAKLLRVLQEREVLPLGARVPTKVSMRVISASNRDLQERVREGRFRADLYYRLRGLQFHIPPLRHRREDIPPFVMEFAARAAADYGKDIRGVSRRALALLMEHDWPGNIRELESEIRRAVLICPNGSALQAEHFATVNWLVEHPSGEREPVRPKIEAPPAFPTAALGDRVAAVERAEIERVLLETGWNKSRAARKLGITRNGLALKMKRLGIEEPDEI